MLMLSCILVANFQVNFTSLRSRFRRQPLSKSIDYSKKAFRNLLFFKGGIESSIARIEIHTLDELSSFPRAEFAIHTAILPLDR